MQGMAERTIVIKTGSVTAEAVLTTSRTADAIWKSLPLTGRVNTWGEEIYFTIPVKMDLEDGKEVVNEGDLGYWPAGHAFCIFFGQTPVSTEHEIRPASAVNLFGRLKDDPKAFTMVKDGEKIVIEKK